MSVWTFCLAFALVATTVREATAIAAQTPPTWPDSYEFEYTLSRSLTTVYMPNGFQMPVHVWRQGGPVVRLRVDAYGGVTSYVADYVQNITIYLAPRNNELVCKLSAASLRSDGVIDILPNLANFEFAGTAKIRTVRARVWQRLQYLKDGTVGRQLFYTAISNGRPLRYIELAGAAIVYEITAWRPGPIADSVFNWPSQCVTAREQQQLEQNVFGSHLLSLLPSAHFAAESIATITAHAELVAGHNAKYKPHSCNTTSGVSYKLALNHFAHIPSDVFKRTHTGGYKSETSSTGGKAKKATIAPPPELTFKRIFTDDELPTQVDWRGTGADGVGPKDQMDCGSCYTFGTAGAMTGAWYQATSLAGLGISVSFSEQQLKDCTWNYGASGCHSGNHYNVLLYVADAGGAVQEGELPYLPESTYCATGLKKPANFDNATAPAPEGIARVNGFLGPMLVTPSDEKALMEAVWRYGPVAVILNSDGFQFYSEGIYHSEECATDKVQDKLDHIVVLMGYGTDEVTGLDYWIIKNSWSQLWGMQGYMLISRKYDCGITLDPVVAVVNPVAVMEAVGALKGLPWAKKAQLPNDGGSRRMLREDMQHV